MSAEYKIISVIAFIWGFIIGMIVWTHQANASEFHLIELRDAYIDYHQFLPGGSDPLITQNGLPDRALDRELDLHLDVDFLKFGYFNNMVHSMTDQGADGSMGSFRVVGWNWRLGVRVTPFLDLWIDHYSQHLLDTTYAYGHFPLQDSVGFTVRFFDIDQSKSALLNVR